MRANVGRTRGRKARVPEGESRGLGDTVAKITHATYLASLVDLWGDVSGADCNCEKRRRVLNRLVPYPKKARPKTGA